MKLLTLLSSTNILNKTLKNTPSEKAKVINDLIISISKFLIEQGNLY